MNKTYENLYTTDSTGNTRVWWMEQINNKYRTCSGVLGGKIVESEYTICDGKNVGKKNETSPTEQATSEILNKYKKQKKTGYHTNVNDAKKGCSYVEPMLAKKYNDYEDKIDFSKSNWGIQIKFNGNRCIATRDGLFTRKGEKYISVPHINKSLEKFFEKHPDAVLDGELYNYDLRQQLNELSKLVRKTVHITDEDYDHSKQIVKYYVYDGYNFNGLDETAQYSERKSWIDKNVVGKYSYVEEVKTWKITDKKQLDVKFKEFISDDEEGGILRDLDGEYEHKRSKYLLKMKSEDDDEAVIVNIKEGTGNWSGAGKIITLKWKDKTFDATFKGSYEDCVTFLKEKNKWIGKEVTFLYNGLTGLNVPNYARIDYKNCIKGDR